MWYLYLASVSRYWANSDVGISDFRISGQSLMKENFYNPRNSNDFNIKLGPVTKLDKRNKTTSLDEQVMLANWDIIITSLLRKPDACNLWHNILKLYNVLTQIRSTTSKTKFMEIVQNKESFFVGCICRQPSMEISDFIKYYLSNLI